MERNCFCQPKFRRGRCYFLYSSPYRHFVCSCSNGTGPFTVQAHTNNANNNGVLEVLHLENKVLLYPNPTQSTITIEHPSIEKIAIYDVMGS